MGRYRCQEYVQRTTYWPIARTRGAPPARRCYDIKPTRSSRPHVLETSRSRVQQIHRVAQLRNCSVGARLSPRLANWPHCELAPPAHINLPRGHVRVRHWLFGQPTPEASASTRSSRPLLRRHAEQSEAKGRAHGPERAYSATSDENSTAERLSASRASDIHTDVSSATQACGVRAPCAGDRPVQRKALGGRSPRQRLDTGHLQQHLRGGCDPPLSRCVCSANDEARSEQAAPRLASRRVGEHEVACQPSKPRVALKTHVRPRRAGRAAVSGRRPAPG